jgi:hypothetical protein
VIVSVAGVSGEIFAEALAPTTPPTIAGARAQEK